MRSVWMIIADFYPGVGGAERQAQRVSKFLIDQGVSVQVLARRHGFEHLRGVAARDRVDGIPVWRVYSRGGRKLGSLLFALNGLRCLVRRGRGGIYHAHDVGAPAWLALVAKYMLGGKAVIKLRTGRDRYAKRYRSKLGRWQFRTLLHRADRLVVVNREVVQYVREAGVPPERVVYVPNAVDTAVFHPVSEAEKTAARRRLGFSEAGFVVLFVGRLEPVKGGGVLLEAWAQLPEAVRSEARLVFVGDGSARSDWQGMIGTLGLQETVMLEGARDTVQDYYAAADLFVLPSRSEGLSNALVEAMACGLPVIASNVGGALDLVEAGTNGVLFEKEDAADLAKRLIWMFERQKAWRQMGDQARQTIVYAAELETVAGRLYALYDKLGAESDREKRGVLS